MIKQMSSIAAILTCFGFFLSHCWPCLNKASEDKGVSAKDTSARGVFARNIFFE